MPFTLWRSGGNLVKRVTEAEESKLLRMQSCPCYTACAGLSTRRLQAKFTFIIRYLDPSQLLLGNEVVACSNGMDSGVIDMPFRINPDGKTTSWWVEDDVLPNGVHWGLNVYTQTETTFCDGVLMDTACTVRMEGGNPLI